MDQENIIRPKAKSISGFQRSLRSKEMGVFGALVVMTILMSFLNRNCSDAPGQSREKSWNIRRTAQCRFQGFKGANIILASSG